MALTPTLSLITTNVNQHNTKIKRQHSSNWIKNKTQLLAVYTRDILNGKTKKYLKKKAEQDIPCNHKMVDVPVLKSDKLNWKPKHIARNKEEYFIMRTRSIPQKHNDP